MTSRERMTAALNHTEPDRTPIFEYVLLSPVAEAFLDRKYADFGGDYCEWLDSIKDIGWEKGLKQYATDRIDLAVALGHDMIYTVPNPLPPQPAQNNSITAGLPDDPVERVRLRTEQANESFSAQPDDMFLVYRLLKEEMQNRDLDLPILAPAYAHGVWTDVDLMQTMALDPEVAKEHFALATRTSLQFIERYISLGIDMIGVGGDFAGNRPLISPAAYREFIMPEVRKVSDTVHAAGLKSVNASDGNLWSVIEDFLIGCDVDGYLEIEMNAGMDLKKLKDEYGSRITLFGNMDCGQIMSFSSPDEVCSHTIACLEAGLGNGGHVFCCSNAITASVPLENYVSMVNAYRDMFGLAKI